MAINLSEIQNLKIIPADKFIYADGQRMVGTDAMWYSLPADVHSVNNEFDQVEVQYRDPATGWMTNTNYDSFEDISFSDAFDWEVYVEPELFTVPEVTADDYRNSIYNSARELVLWLKVIDTDTAASLISQLQAVAAEAKQNNTTDFTATISALDDIRAIVLAEINSELLGI